jgi:hyperosmotically inducible protein
MNIKLAILISALLVPGIGMAAESTKNEPSDPKKAEVTPQTKGEVKSTVKNAGSEIKETVGDTVITTKIKAAYAKDKQVSALNIKVDTDQKGVVILSGTAKTKAEADKAVAIAKRTKGVRSVTNDIKIESVAAAKADTKMSDTKKADTKK